MQDFELDLKVLHRASDYLVARILYGGELDQERYAVISHIEFGSIEQFCPYLSHNHPPHNHNPGSVQLYLKDVFGISHD